MAIFSRIIFETVKWRARRGLNCGEEPLAGVKEKARRRGVRSETFAYWYLRRHEYVLVARNCVPREVKGEIDLIGYDGETLAFVEVRTRTARRFLMVRHVKECPLQFDVVAIEEFSGQSPVVRLHKNAFNPRM
jgi:Holliday junction resolvase-like predicted endonuclease